MLTASHYNNYYNNYYVSVTPILNFSKQFGPNNNIVVTLAWFHKNGVSYSISVDPEVDINYIEENDSAQLILLYNTKYNVSVIASLCGKNSTTSSIINHGKLYLLSDHND